MLLSEEPQLRHDLIGSFGGGRKTLFQVGVLLLGRCEALVGEQVAGRVRRLQCSYATFRRQRTAAESRELLTEIANELLQLMERRNIISAVGHRALLRGREESCSYDLRSPYRVECAKRP